MASYFHLTLDTVPPVIHSEYSGHNRKEDSIILIFTSNKIIGEIYNIYYKGKHGDVHAVSATKKLNPNVVAAKIKANATGDKIYVYAEIGDDVDNIGIASLEIPLLEENTHRIVIETMAYEIVLGREAIVPLESTAYSIDMDILPYSVITEIHANTITIALED